jgi:hypothetical protein
MSQWISVEDRLPEPWVDVIGYYGRAVVAKFDVVHCYPDPVEFDPDAVGWIPLGGVTHWMPLPEPPQSA